ncbi:hypothetical protein [Scytonema sp. NUACC26]
MWCHRRDRTPKQNPRLITFGTDLVRSLVQGEHLLQLIPAIVAKKGAC